MRRLIFLVGFIVFFAQLPAQKTILEKTLSRNYSPEETVTLSESLPFSKAIEILSQISQRNIGKKIVSTAGLSEPIGIRVENTYFMKALSIIVQYNNLMFEEQPNVIIVKAKTDKTVGLSPAEYAAVDSREVKISAIIFEANITELKERGINWEWLISGKGVNIGTNLLTYGAEAQTEGSSSTGLTPDWSVSSDTKFNMGEFSGTAVAAFKFFESENLGDVIAKPTVTVRDGIQGKIQIGSDLSIKQKDFSGNVVESFVPTGTIINVTPRIYNEDNINYVLLKLAVERSSAIVDQLATEIKKTLANTEVLLFNGEETIIGGLFVTEDVTARRGIPVLRDLPWWVLGLRYLTGYDYSQVIKKEIIILVRAEIIPTIKERIAQKQNDNLIRDKFKADEEEIKKYKIHSFNKEK